MNAISYALMLAFAAFFSYLLPPSCQNAVQQEALTPKQILARMAKAYSECKSYSDTGLVKTVYISDNGRKRIVEKPFTTAFIRPDRFRFEYKEQKGDQNEYTDPICQDIFSPYLRWLVCPSWRSFSPEFGAGQMGANRTSSEYNVDDLAGG